MTKKQVLRKSLWRAINNSGNLVEAAAVFIQSLKEYGYAIRKVKKGDRNSKD